MENMLSKCLVLVSVVLALDWVMPVRCGVPQLDGDELVALQRMVKTMGIELLDSSHNPCESNMLMIPPYPPGPEQGNTILCNCQFNNNSTCRITVISLKSYSLPGIVPPEMVLFPYLEKIELTRNYLSGTLPKSWASMKSLKFLSLTANRVTGEIPREWGNFPSLTYLSLEANQLSGNIPPELGNMLNLRELSLTSNRFVGSLPKELARLNLTDFRINDNSFSGTIPDFIESWTQLSRLDLSASGLEGPIPAGISCLKNLRDLRITDLTGANFRFPSQLPNDMTTLVLRNLNISGPIPNFIWAMKGLKLLDITFNKLEGEVPSSANIPAFTFLSGNMLNGTLSNSTVVAAKNLDLSYNNFCWSPKCPEKININLYRSSSQKNNLSGVLPCSSRSKCPKYYTSLHINCGGESMVIKNNHGTTLYEGDKDITDGASRNYISKTNWGFSSTGDFMDDGGRYDIYTESNSSVLYMNQSELYMTARKAALSLTYYGFCLKNGNYTVRLHFAEIKFRDEEAYSSLGRRIFDIYVQGKLEKKDFNIKEEANGTGREVIKLFDATVADNTFEVRLYWAGKGTTVIPTRGIYGVKYIRNPFHSGWNDDPQAEPAWQRLDREQGREQA